MKHSVLGLLARKLRLIGGDQGAQTFGLGAVWVRVDEGLRARCGERALATLGQRFDLEHAGLGQKYAFGPSVAVARDLQQRGTGVARVEGDARAIQRLHLLGQR